MTRDPDEGIDEYGNVRTGVSRQRVAPAYEPLLEEAADQLRSSFGDALHSLYVYGSVATGQARAPASDLDLLAVWRHRVPDGEAEAVTAGLSQRHAGLVREVGLAQMSLHELDAPGDTGVGNRAFVRHYCVPLLGEDLRARLEPCAVGQALVRGFNGDLTEPLDGWLADVSRPGVNAADVARSASRRLLLAAATTLSVRHGTWSTDRATAVALVQAHHPEWAADATTALRWCAVTEADARQAVPSVVQKLLSGFGSWIAEECPGTAAPHQSGALTGRRAWASREARDRPTDGPPRL